MKKLDLINPLVKKKLFWELSWIYNTKFKWEWLEYSDIQEYFHWDPVKHIDFKSSAKLQKLYSKKYEAIRELNVLFLIDVWSSIDFKYSDFTKKDLICDIFKSLRSCVLSSNDKLSVITFSDKINDYYKSSTDKNNIIKVLKTLEKIDKNEFYSDLNIVLDEALNRKIKNTLIFIISDDTSFDFKKMKSIAKDNQIVYLNVFDEFEANLDNLWSNIYFSDNKKILNFDLSDKNKLKNYKNNIQSKFNNLERDLNKIGIKYINITNTSDYFVKLLKWLKK